MWQSFLRSFLKFLPFRTQPIRAAAVPLRSPADSLFLSSRARTLVRVEGSAVRPSNLATMGDGVKLSAERGWTNKSGHTPRPNGHAARKAHLQPAQTWRAAKSGVTLEAWLFSGGQ